jgi:hypothetical protein
MLIPLSLRSCHWCWAVLGCVWNVWGCFWGLFLGSMVIDVSPSATPQEQVQINKQRSLLFLTSLEWGSCYYSHAATFQPARPPHRTHTHQHTSKTTCARPPRHHVHVHTHILACMYTYTRQHVHAHVSSVSLDAKMLHLLQSKCL